MNTKITSGSGIHDRISTNVLFVNNVLEEIFKKMENKISDDGEKLLLDAMRYSTIHNGKRLRSFLCIESGSIFNIKPETMSIISACIEMVHAYSLIHDDLPPLDNSDFRRDKPSCHKQFGEAAAILAGNSLLTLAFEILVSDMLDIDYFVRAELIAFFTRAIGYKGMMAGQMLDILMQKNKSSYTGNDLVHMQRLKTGQMFAFATCSGAIVAKTQQSAVDSLTKYGLELGFLYQIIDDILDYKSELSIKTKSKSASKVISIQTMQLSKKFKVSGNEASFVDVAGGAEQAILHANSVAEVVKNHLESFGDKATYLSQFVDHILEYIKKGVN